MIGRIIKLFYLFISSNTNELVKALETHKRFQDSDFLVVFKSEDNGNRYFEFHDSNIDEHDMDYIHERMIEFIQDDEDILDDYKDILNGSS